MITDTEIKFKGFHILTKYLGDVEAERFIALIQREPFDYTQWRQDMDEELSIEEISCKAMALRHKSTRQNISPDSLSTKLLKQPVNANLKETV